MRELTRYQRWYGRDVPPAERREARAGHLSAVVEGPDLRYVRFGRDEVIRRLFVAVRDRNWGTVTPEVSVLDLEERDGGFSLHVEAHCLDVPLGVDFRWTTDIVASAEGELDCSFAGIAESDFLYNRIGFCVLHPADNAGRPYRAHTPDGEIAGTLPGTCGAQLIVDGLPAPLFPAFDEIEIEVADGLWAHFTFEGDLFEIEDQRNWTDASFKTYSTPLGLGFPHEARTGEQIAQRVRLTFAGEPAPAQAVVGPVRVRFGEARGRLPALGLGEASHGRPLSAREAGLLAALRPEHLRADIDLADPGWSQQLARAAADARAIGAALELAVFVPEDPAGIDALARTVESLEAPLARVLVFRRGEPVTSADAIRLTRERLGDAAPVYGGTNILFTDLNRVRPELEPLDGIAWSLSATVHADDDTSVVETTAMQGETVRSACAFCGDLPLAVTPVTFNLRFNPNATGPEPEPGPGELPSQVDRRQPSLLGAGWTLGSAKHLAEAGAASVTYFETTGWRGVIEADGGSPVPERFCSWPGMAFPLYHVLADLGEWKEGELVEASSSEPLAAEALAVRTGEELHVLLANLGPTSRRCQVTGLPPGRASVRVLDETTFAAACDEPASFRAGAAQVVAAAASGQSWGQTSGRGPVKLTPGFTSAQAGTLELELRPYAIARIDVAG